MHRVIRGLGRMLPQSLRRPLRRALARLDGSAAPVAGTRDYRIRFRRAQVGGDVFLVPEYARNFAAARLPLSGKVYEPATHALVAALLARRQGDMVHAGAFYGDMLPSFSRACAGRVWAFEPVLETYVLARLCIEENGLGNVLLANAALGERPGLARIGIRDAEGRHQGAAAQIGARDPEGGTGAAAGPERGQTITVTTIDACGIEDLALLQLDVEGFELPALSGAAGTIARCRPLILIEDNAEACATFLAGHGYAPVGRVPGLALWRPEEDAEADAALCEILEQARAAAA